MMRIFLAAAGLAAAISGVATAQSCCEPPGTDWIGSYDLPATGMAPPATAMLGEMTVTFEQTTLADVAAALGGEIQHTGDAGESQYWLCYTTPDSRIWVIAHGEMGGDNHVVTEVAVAGDPSGEAFGACPMAEAGPVTVAGVGLGSDTAALEAAFGAPGVSNEDGNAYYMEVPAEQADCTVSSFAAAQLDSGTVLTLNVTHITAC